MTKKFNRKEAIALLDVAKYTRKIAKEFEPINTGWVICWKGKAVKPQGGKNHYYASYDAAIQGIERNISFYREIEKEMAPKIYGFELDSPEWEEYFREDLWWDKNYHDGKLVSRSSREEPLTEEEEKIRSEMYDEKRKFEGFCSNALKTVLVKAWLANGLLEIKEV